MKLQMRADRSMILIVAGYAMLAAMIIVSIGFASQQRDNGAALERTLGFENQLEVVFSHLQDAETGARGYVATGDAWFLEPYRNALTTLNPDLDRLGQLARDEPRLRAGVARLRTLASAKMLISSGAVSSKRSANGQPTQIMLQLRQGKVIMDEIRGQIHGVYLANGERLRERQAAFETTLGRLQVVLLIGLVAVAAMTILGLRSHADDVSRLRAKNDELAHRAQMLADSEARVQQSNDHLERRVEERTAQLLAANTRLDDAVKGLTEALEITRQRTAELARSNEALEAANLGLESFSYSVSHDLRTPLRAIDGFSRILIEDESDKLDAEGQRLLNVVRDNTVKMGRLIDDILSFSRSTRGELTSTQIDTASMVQGVIDELQPALAGRKVRFDIKALAVAQGDGVMIRRVWTNLIDNAVKYTRLNPDAVIEIGSTAGVGEIVYYVKDNGVGFDMQYVGKLYGVFQRLHGDEFPGTGIGLAIVKRIISKHHGRVWAEGKVGEGASFYFTLPISETTDV